ncbi:MAG: hypothetical protein RL180_1598 [Pseudomonadota bacterium]
MSDHDVVPTLDFAPTASWDAMRVRALVYQQIRQFFADRGVLEVETPLLSQAAVTDLHLASVSAQVEVNGQIQTRYLHTSPEFAMKRLVAAGSGAIYQICKVFRDGERGRRHNIEFSMLEWYQPSYTLEQLMHELTALLNVLFESEFEPEVRTYREAFLRRINLDPLQATAAQLKDCARQLGLTIQLGDDRLAWMDLLFSHFIEPTLGIDGPLYLTEFPAEMASLAQVRMDAHGNRVAARFELYLDGLEIANAYDELADAPEQARRFAADNLARTEHGLPVMPIDHHLLAALEVFPPCAGIALGLDRLLMVLRDTRRIDQVIGFTVERA